MNLATYIDRLESPDLPFRVGIGTVLRTIPPHPFPDQLRMVIRVSDIRGEVTLVNLTSGGLTGTLASSIIPVDTTRNLSPDELRRLVDDPAVHEIITRDRVAAVFDKLLDSRTPEERRAAIHDAYNRARKPDDLPRVDQLSVCPKCGAKDPSLNVHHIPSKGDNEFLFACRTDCPDDEHMHAICQKCCARIVARPVT